MRDARWSGAHLEARALQPPPLHMWTPAAPTRDAGWVWVQGLVKLDADGGALGWGTRDRLQQVPPLQLVLLLPPWVLRRCSSSYYMTPRRVCHAHFDILGSRMTLLLPTVWMWAGGWWGAGAAACGLGRGHAAACCVSMPEAPPPCGPEAPLSITILCG